MLCQLTPPGSGTTAPVNATILLPGTGLLVLAQRHPKQGRGWSQNPTSSTQAFNHRAALPTSPTSLWGSGSMSCASQTPQRVFDVLGPELTLSESLNLFYPHRTTKTFRVSVCSSDAVLPSSEAAGAHRKLCASLTAVRQTVNYLWKRATWYLGFKETRAMGRRAGKEKALNPESFSLVQDSLPTKAGCTEA